MKSLLKKIIATLTLALGLMFASSVNAQDVVIVDSSPLHLQSQSAYQGVPAYQLQASPTVSVSPFGWGSYSVNQSMSRINNVVSTSVLYAQPFISTSRQGFSRARTGTRRAAGRATNFYLEWHPVSWIAQDLGILDADRVRRFVNGN